MMLTMPNSTHSKRDLHIGGTGATAPTAIATGVEPWQPRGRVHDAFHVFRGATRVLHENKLASLSLAALVGVTAGYLLSRRF